MRDNRNVKKIRETAIAFLALASMLLTGCATLFGGKIEGGTRLDDAFGPYEKEVNFIQSTRGKIDVRLNFDGEYEGSKYASSYPDAFYISPELSNSTDDLEYFQFLYMIDDRYTVYCYQTHPYKNGDKRSDGVKTQSDNTENAYIMYPEVVIDEKYDVNPDKLVTILAVYDYTAEGKKGYHEIRRWECAESDPAAYCFSKLGYTKTETEDIEPRNLVVCTNQVVVNYTFSDIRNYIGNPSEGIEPIFETNLNDAFQYFLDGPENRKRADSEEKIISTEPDENGNVPYYELEVYNLAVNNTGKDTFIYLDMTASTKDAGTVPLEDEEAIEAEYNSDDPTADAPESEYDDADDDDDAEDETITEEDEAEAQADLGSYDFLCSIVNSDVPNLRVYCGPTKEGTYTVQYHQDSSPHDIYSIYAHIMSEPKFHNFYRMADYDGNAPFITMALYETADVLGFGTLGKQYDASGNEIEDTVFDEEGWKKINNNYARFPFYMDIAGLYRLAYETEKEYYSYIENFSKQISLGLTKKDPVPLKDEVLYYDSEGKLKSDPVYEHFPVTITGDWKVISDPLEVATRRITGRDEVHSFVLGLENAHLNAISFANMSSAENTFEPLYDDVIIGWNKTKVYDNPKSISGVYYLPENFAEIFTKNYARKAAYNVPVEASNTPLGYDVSDNSYTEVPKLKEMNFLVTDQGPYVLAVKDGEVLATPGVAGYDSKNALSIVTKNFTQTVSEVSESQLTINTELSGSSSAYWNKQDGISDNNFAVDSSFKNGVTAGFFNIFLDTKQETATFDSVKKEMREGNDEDASLTCIIGSDGVHFAKANGEDLTDTLSYADIDILLDPKTADEGTIKAILKSDVLVNNWNQGAKISELVRENLRYRYLISFNETADGSITINIAEAKVDSVKTAKSFSVKAPKEGSSKTIESQVDKKNTEYSKYFGIDYWNSIRQYILDSVQVDKHVYTKYKKAKNSSYSVIGAENLDLKVDSFDGSQNKESWWICSTALYGLGFQKYNNTEEYFIPTFQRVQHTLNTTSVYDEEDDLKDTTAELETSIVSLKNGIACYGIYKNINAAKDLEENSKGEKTITYPYVFIGFDNQGNVYTESEVCRAKVIPFGFTGENFSKTVAAGSQKVTLDVTKRGDDKVIYYLRDSFVNKSGQEIIMNPRDALDKDDLLDKITGRIHGYVTDLEGNGVEDITATLTGPLEGTAYTYSEGKFEFRRLTAGTYILNESIEGVDIATFQVIVGEGGKIEKIYTDDFYKCEAKTEFKGNDAYIYLSNFEGIDEIDKISGRVLGYVYNEKGEGVKKVTAKIDGPVQAEAVTQNGGSFSVRRLTEGLYTVTEIYNKVEIASFEVKIGPTGEIENIDVVDYYNCEPDTLIQGKTARLTLNNFKGAKYSEDEFTGRIISKITDGKGNPVKGITTSVTGSITASANTGSNGQSKIKRLDKGVYYVSESYGEKTIATYKVVVGARGKISSIEVLSYVDCSTTTSVDGNEAYIEITGDPNIADWPGGKKGGNSGDTNGKKKDGVDKKKSISHNDRKKKTTPKDTLEERDPEDIINEFFGDSSGNDDVSGNGNIREDGDQGKMFEGNAFEGNYFGEGISVGEQGFWDWITSHLKQFGLLLLLILAAAGYAIYRKKKGKSILPDKVKSILMAPIALITNLFKRK